MVEGEVMGADGPQSSIHNIGVDNDRLVVRIGEVRVKCFEVRVSIYPSLVSHKSIKALQNLIRCFTFIIPSEFCA